MGFGFKQPLVGEKRCVTTLITAAKETNFHPARAQVRCLQCLSKSFRSRHCLRTAHARQGGNSVWQMGKYVFLWLLPSLSHLNKLFCNLHDL